MNQNIETRGAGGGALRQLTIRVSEAARMLDIGRSKAYELVRSGELPSIRVGKTVRIPLDALEEWVHRQSEPKEVT